VADRHHHVDACVWLSGSLVGPLLPPPQEVAIGLAALSAARGIYIGDAVDPAG